MDPTLRDKILQDNISEHRKEARFYDRLHIELSNRYEQSRLKTKLSTIINTIQKKTIRVMDVGSGTGNLCSIITQLSTDRTFEITALDISDAMQEVMKAKLKDSQVRYVVSDVDGYLQKTETEMFDLITISSVLHHLPDYKQTLQSLSNHLNPGGVIYATHEPLNVTEHSASLFYAFMNFTDNVLQFIRTKGLIASNRIPNLKINYALIDYHINERGIFPESLQIDGLDMTIERYSINYHLAPLTNALGFYNSFELIFRKTVK